MSDPRRTAIVNIGRIVTGDLHDSFGTGDTIIMQDGVIERVGTASESDLVACEVVVDAEGLTAIPGLIDSHVHITFGDYTPRQKTVGYLESYVHGGVTTAISASEVHVPGRPKHASGLKALAIAAKSCFEHYRPGGMKVYAGSVILEPTLNDDDIHDLVEAGVWLAKAGFGAFDTPYDYAPLMHAARTAGMVTTMHTGGSSIPGSTGIWAEHVLASDPTVAFHCNGGPTAMPVEGYARLVHESKTAMQVCTAGNLANALLTANMLDEAGMPERLILGTDTPSGSGIMPLGILYTMSQLVSLGKMQPERAIAAATGNNATVYGLNSGFLKEGRDADVVLVGACAGGAKDDPFDSLRNGDIFGIGAVFTAGTPRFVGKSRNTPGPIRAPRVARCNLPMNYDSGAH